MKRKGLTRIDALVAIACIVFLFINIGILTAGARKSAKKEVCLANIQALTAGWQAYAEDNGGKVVNGSPSQGAMCQDCPYNCKAMAPIIPTDYRYKELPWVGTIWNNSDWRIPAPESCQRCAIKTGALWKYVKTIDIYRCPDINQNFLFTYSIIDSMNGFGDIGRGVPTSLVKSLVKKNISQIETPDKKIVFIEEMIPTPDSFGVYYNIEKWFDLPCIRHNNGTNVSFADGHGEFWKWKSQETISIGNGGTYAIAPVSASAKQDLYRVQIGCWGKLGYTPTVPVE